MDKNTAKTQSLTQQRIKVLNSLNWHAWIVSAAWSFKWINLEGTGNLELVKTNLDRLSELELEINDLLQWIVVARTQR